MKKTLILPDTIRACHELILQQAALIERLQGRAFGGSLKDRALKYEGPSLFEEYEEEARLAAAKELEKASKDVDERLPMFSLSMTWVQSPGLYKTMALAPTRFEKY